MMEHSKEAIVSAFIRLIGRRVPNGSLPSIAELLGEAGVARSTLYRYFDDRTSLLVAAMHGPLEILSHTAVQGNVTPQLVGLLEHFWTERRIACLLLEQRYSVRLARNLGERISLKEFRLQRSDAVLIAHTQITLLRLWLGGETVGSPADIADKIARSSSSQLAAFIAEPFETIGRTHGSASHGSIDCQDAS